MSYNATERYTAIFSDLLVKESADPEVNTASVSGENPDQYPDTTPEKEMPAVAKPTQEAYDHFIAGRDEMLKDLFGQFGTAQKQDQSGMRDILEHGRAGEYESKAPLLSEAADDPMKEAQAVFAQQLLE